jgi:hypothetical protein
VREAFPLPTAAEGRCDEQRRGQKNADERAPKLHVISLRTQRGRLLIGIEIAGALPSQGDQDVCATGNSNVNVEPLPGSDSTQISPCIALISSRQM